MVWVFSAVPLYIKSPSLRYGALWTPVLALRTARSSDVHRLNVQWHSLSNPVITPGPGVIRARGGCHLLSWRQVWSFCRYQVPQAKSGAVFSNSCL